MATFLRITPVAGYRCALLFVCWGMETALIQLPTKEDLELLMALVRKMGGKSVNLTEDESEDLSLGVLMQQQRTGENVSREEVMAKLRGA